MLPISDKYGIQDLKDACAVALQDRICRDNVVHIMTVAHLYCCPDLKKKCFEHLAHCKTSLSSEDLKILYPYPELMGEALLLS